MTEMNGTGLLADAAVAEMSHQNSANDQEQVEPRMSIDEGDGERESPDPEENTIECDVGMQRERGRRGGGGGESFLRRAALL